MSCLVEIHVFRNGFVYMFGNPDKKGLHWEWIDRNKLCPCGAPETCPKVQWLMHFSRCRHTVDGRNSANPTWDVEKPVNNGINYQPQLVQI